MSSPLFCYVWEPELNTDERLIQSVPGLIYLRPRLSVSQDGGCGPKELPRNLGLDPILRRILFANEVTEARPSVKSRLPPSTRAADRAFWAAKSPPIHAPVLEHAVAADHAHAWCAPKTTQVTGSSFLLPIHPPCL